MRTQLALGVAIAAASSTASAGANNDEVSFGGTTRALRSPSANALTDANLGGVSLGYARDLGFDLMPRLSLWADAGFTSSFAEGKLFQAISTEIASLDLGGGLRARYQLHRLVAVSARLDLGAQRVRLDLDDPSDRASDHRWGTRASAGAAVDLFATSRAPFGIGVRAELGYVMAQSIELTLHRDAPSDVVALPMTELAVGRLDLSGPTVAVSVIGQF
jgi:hypothetical protein